MLWAGSSAGTWSELSLWRVNDTLARLDLEHNPEELTCWPCWWVWYSNWDFDGTHGRFQECFSFRTWCLGIHWANTLQKLGHLELDLSGPKSWHSQRNPYFCHSNRGGDTQIGIKAQTRDPLHCKWIAREWLHDWTASFGVCLCHSGWHWEQVQCILLTPAGSSSNWFWNLGEESPKTDVWDL